jgi:hypothetical protein
MDWTRLFLFGREGLQGLLAVIGAGVAVVGAGTLFAAGMKIANEYFKRRAERKTERARRRYDRQKWYAEFFLAPKLEAFRNLHTALVRTHFELNLRANMGRPATLADYKEQVEAKERNYFDAMTVAEIYMDDETNRIMHEVLGAIRQVGMAIWLQLPDAELPRGLARDSYGPEIREVNWRQFVNTYETAIAKLRELLHPEQELKAVEIFAEAAE